MDNSDRPPAPKKRFPTKPGPKPKFQPVEILAAVRLHGSIHKAANALGISYRTAQEHIAKLAGTPEYDEVARQMDKAISFSLADFLVKNQETLERMMKKLERQPSKWIWGWGVVATNKARLSGLGVSGTVNIDHKVTIEDKRERFLRIEELKPRVSVNGN